MKHANGLCWLPMQGGNDLFPCKCAHLLFNVTVLLYFFQHLYSLNYINISCATTMFWNCHLVLVFPSHIILKEQIAKKSFLSLTITEAWHFAVHRHVNKYWIRMNAIFYWLSSSHWVLNTQWLMFSLMHYRDRDQGGYLAVLNTAVWACWCLALLTAAQLTRWW